MDELNNIDIEKINKFSFKNMEFIAKVIECIDGDTIDVIFKFENYYKFRIRMLGYNSPELKPHLNIDNRDEIIKKAILAKEHITTLILNKVVHIICDDFDNFGRILATVYYNDICINEHMLQTGHGIPFNK